MDANSSSGTYIEQRKAAFEITKKLLKKFKILISQFSYAYRTNSNYQMVEKHSELYTQADLAIEKIDSILSSNLNDLKDVNFEGIFVKKSEFFSKGIITNFFSLFKSKTEEEIFLEKYLL